MALSATACLDETAPPVPLPGDTRLSVPYHQQIDTNNNNYCVPATVLMWLDYVNPAPFPDTYEDTIWQFADSHGWAAPGGIDNYAIPLIVSNFIGYQTLRAVYNGTTEIRKAVADQQKGIAAHDPTLVEANYGIHAVLVVGASWQELSDARPSIDYMVIHDPAKFHTGFELYTLNAWMGSKGLACSGACAAQTMRQGQFFAAAEYDAFEAAGGTYYGDPNPPVSGRWKLGGDGSCYWDPNDFGPDQCSEATGRWKLGGDGSCYWDPNDGGPDQCQPEARGPRSDQGHLFGRVRSTVQRTLQVLLASSTRRQTLTRAMIRGKSGLSGFGTFSRRGLLNAAPRQMSPEVARRPPYPRATSSDKILANILFAARQMKLPEQFGSELYAEDDALVVARILDVKSEVTEDYYVVELDDKAGNPYSDVLISKTGWLKSIADVRMGRQASVPDIHEVAARLRAKFKGPITVEYYYAGGNVQGPSGSEYIPLIKAETSDGTILVDMNLEMYRENLLEKFGASREAETMDLGRKRRGQLFLVKRDGIATVTKLGRL